MRNHRCVVVTASAEQDLMLATTAMVDEMNANRKQCRTTASGVEEFLRKCDLQPVRLRKIELQGYKSSQALLLRRIKMDKVGGAVEQRRHKCVRAERAGAAVKSV